MQSLYRRGVVHREVWSGEHIGWMCANIIKVSKCCVFRERTGISLSPRFARDRWRILGSKWPEIGYRNRGRPGRYLKLGG